MINTVRELREREGADLPYQRMSITLMPHIPNRTLLYFMFYVCVCTPFHHASLYSLHITTLKTFLHESLLYKPST